MRKTIYVLVEITVEDLPLLSDLNSTGYLTCDNLRLESLDNGYPFEEYAVSWETIKFGETPNSF